jgi:TatD DNase family protein
MLIDTHAHLNFPAFKNDAAEVIKRSLGNGVWMINVGSQYSTSKRAVEMAERYPEGVYAAVGLHPIYARDGLDYEKYKKLAQSKKAVAVGEIGLDYKPEYLPSKEKQKEVFLSQLSLAKELNLPVIFHCRMAHEDLIKILNYKLKTINRKLIGVVHCFTGDWKQAKKYLKMGLYLGFNGLIFKMDFSETIKKAPLEKILIETDCPYLTPPQKHPERNEPMYLKYIAQRIAEVKNLNYNKVADVTAKNAKELFNI